MSIRPLISQPFRRNILQPLRSTAQYSTNRLTKPSASLEQQVAHNTCRLSALHQSLRDHKADSTAQAKDSEASMEMLQKEIMHAHTTFQNDRAGLRKEVWDLRDDTAQVRRDLIDVSSAVKILKAQKEEEAKKKKDRKMARDWYWIYASYGVIGAMWTFLIRL